MVSLIELDRIAMKPEIINFRSCNDDRGKLVAIEGASGVPFDIKRVYYIYQTKEGVERGFHAHRALTQVAVAVAGSCRMHLDNGFSRASVDLNSPEYGILIKPGVWREMREFSGDCVLLVLADQHYDESDYIREYPEFKQWILENKV